LGGLVFVGIICSTWAVTQPCSPNPPTIGAEENRLTIVIPSPVVSLDPTNYRDRNTQIVLKNMFDSLTTRDGTMTVVPQLAESWRALSDTVWEFRLRRGVTFHTGDALTAADVKFTLDRVTQEGALDGKTSPRKALLGSIAAVRVRDAYTVHIETQNPWATLPLMLTLQEIVPKKYMESAGSKGFQTKPVGTGPFRFVEARNDGLLVLERFDAYYGGSPENPPVQTAPLDYLMFRAVPESIERIAMLKRGECDIITHVPPESIPILEAVPDIEVVSCPATRSYFAEMNCIKKPFDDPRVRRAMMHAVDMVAVTDHILLGRGTILPTVLLPNAFAYNDSLEPYPYDPELARELLVEAGFSEGLSIVINCTESHRQFANVIAIFLARVGVKSRIDIVDSRNPGTRRRGSAWDILVTSWGNSTLDPVGILVPKFRTNGRGNYSNYSNEDVDLFLSEAEGTLDAEIRKDYYQRIQEIIYHDAPMIFGYAPEEHYGVRRKVRNFRPSPTGMMNIHDVYIENGG